MLFGPTALCFNPLPPCSGGRTQGHDLRQGLVIVSIRSRLVQAGEPSITSTSSCAWPFQSAPALFRRENLRDRIYRTWRAVFQSAPALFRRENIFGFSPSGTVNGFNPLPPCSGGRTRPCWMYHVPTYVSIRSRLVQAGEHGCGAISGGSELFQSAPALFRRENDETGGGLCALRGFNPLPPCSGGRTSPEPELHPRDIVSIRSRLVQAGEPNESIIVFN